VHRHCPFCDRVVPSGFYRQHLRDEHGRRKKNSGAWKRLRLAILERDGRRCTFPGCGETRRLEVHHLDWNPQNDHPANLATRCIAHNPRGADTHSMPGVGQRLA
jgi:hypothetical protein